MTYKAKLIKLTGSKLKNSPHVSNNYYSLSNYLWAAEFCRPSIPTMLTTKWDDCFKRFT